MQRKRISLKLFDDTGMSADIKRALNMLVLAVLFGNASFVVTQGTALTGLVKELGASDFIFSVLMAMPVVGNLMQLASSYLLEKTRKRKFLFVFFGIISRMCWLVVGIAPFIFPNSASTALWTVLLFVTLCSCAGAFINTGFFSIVADIVPMRIRGRYFAMRYRLMMIVGIAAGLLVGALLDAMPGLPGYCVAFSLAALLGTADILCFLFFKIPPMTESEDTTGFFGNIKAVLRDKRFMKIALCMTAWSFSVNVSLPFFNVFMIQELKMSFTYIMLFSQIAANAMTMLFITRWGRMMDTYGNRPVLFLCASIASFIPVLWLFNGEYRFLAVIPIQMLSGALWPAIDLSIQNLYLGAAPQKNRSVYIAVYFVITQIAGVALGMMTGGAVVEALAPIADALKLTVAGFPVTRYNMLFIISAILRFVCVMTLFRLIQEEGSQSVAALIKGIREGAAMGLKTARRFVRAMRPGKLLRRRKQGRNNA